jgi:putative membrane protein
VPSRIERVFSKADREAIRAATAAAETRTAAELVVYVTERCDPHPEVGWKATLIGGACGALFAALGVWLFGGWGSPDYLWILIGLQLGLVAGWLAGRFESIARRLIDREALESRIDGRAAEAFLQERVFATKERTGVLIFVTLFEHRVVVLADEGVATRVRASAWNEISKDLADGIGRGAPAQAMVHAIERCADLLAERGVAGPDATNQLSDEPRFHDD